MARRSTARAWSIVAVSCRLLPVLRAGRKMSLSATTAAEHSSELAAGLDEELAAALGDVLQAALSDVEAGSAAAFQGSPRPNARGAAVVGRRRRGGPHGIALTWLRKCGGRTQREAARALGVRRQQMDYYERGAESLKRSTFLRTAAAAGHTPAEADLALLTVAVLDPDAVPGAPDSEYPGTPTPAEERLVREVAAHRAVEFAALACTCLQEEVGARLAALKRKEALSLWRRLEPYTPAQRKLLVETLSEFQTWALAERLADEAVLALAASAVAAAELAQLGVSAAQLAGGGEAWRHRLEGYTRAHLAYVVRAQGDAAAARAEWQAAWALWRAGAPGDRDHLLSVRRLRALQMSAKRATRLSLQTAACGLGEPMSIESAGRRGRRTPAVASRAPSLPLGLTLTCLRERVAWSRKDLATISSIPLRWISDFEQKRWQVERSRFDEAAAAMGYTRPEVTLTLHAVKVLSTPKAEGSAEGCPDGWEAARRARQAAAHLAVRAAALLQPHLRSALVTRRIAQARQDAGRVWRRLERCTPERRRVLIESEVECRSWAVVERLADESRRAAPRNAEAALDLARLAVTAARLAAGSNGWRRRLEAYARAFGANALRVQGHIRDAASEWTAVWRLWREDAAGDTAALLPEWRLLDLEASLRRDARQFEAALDLLDRAAAAAPPGASGRILLKRACTLELKGEAASALAVLEEAASRVDASGDPRLQFSLAFERIAVLCDLEQFSDAAKLLPGLQRLAFELDNSPDLLRVVWLSGRVAAGTGHRLEACAAFERVAHEFGALRNAFATAIVSLELAVLYLEEGRHAEVRNLAAQMSWILAAEGVERETLASLRLFCEAARQETATIEQARAVLRLLGRRTVGGNLGGVGSPGDA